MSDDELPLCVDVVDAYTINSWFDHWLVQAMKTRGGIQKAEMINKLRRLTLLGASKAKRNQKAVKKVVASVLEGMYQQFASDLVRIEQQ